MGWGGDSDLYARDSPIQVMLRVLISADRVEQEIIGDGSYTV